MPGAHDRQDWLDEIIEDMRAAAQPPAKRRRIRASTNGDAALTRAMRVAAIMATENCGHRAATQRAAGLRDDRNDRRAWKEVMDDPLKYNDRRILDFMRKNGRKLLK